jgi:hypothetical protein
MIKTFTASLVILGVLAGTASAQDTSTTTDALNVVDACARLHQAGTVFRRLQAERGHSYDFSDTPGVSVLAAIVDRRSARTGFTARDCITFEGFPEVMDALQGKSGVRVQHESNLIDQLSGHDERLAETLKKNAIGACMVEYSRTHDLPDDVSSFGQAALDACRDTYASELTQ